MSRQAVVARAAADLLRGRPAEHVEADLWAAAEAEAGREPAQVPLPAAGGRS